ncbi:MAG TPA: DUF167 domain-containing protein [Nitrospiraceae bacterium]|nr:DUF167 domain-containing protein [Nitrospiraceae bacterium]
MKQTPHPEQFPAFLHDSSKGVILTVHIQPNAGRTEYAGIHGDALKFRVAAPPVDGAANDALCRCVAERFGLPASAVELQAGAGARRKRVLLKGLKAIHVLHALQRP